MDQTIRKILELDAETEERLAASQEECRRLVDEARARAAALAEAEGLLKDAWEPVEK